VGYRRAEQVVAEMVDGRAFLLDESGTEMIVLNAVGALVWNALDRATEVDEIVDLLLPEFDEGDTGTIHADVSAFLAELQSLKLVEQTA
jgi:hypothetical protein